mgnify:CR=1 FL=1
MDQDNSQNQYIKTQEEIKTSHLVRNLLVVLLIFVVLYLFFDKFLLNTPKNKNKQNSNLIFEQTSKKLESSSMEEISKEELFNFSKDKQPASEYKLMEFKPQ